MDCLSQLPIELVTHVILLSLDALNSHRKIIRAEELRLVNRAWKTIIESTPLFWTFITDELRSSPETIHRRIENSGEAPLHILLRKDGQSLHAFMLLLSPHIHRWRKLDVQGWGSNISPYTSEPAPTLESLILHSVSLSSNRVPFGGITPSLSFVTLGNVSVPYDPIFLRELRNLSLQNITHGQEHLPLSRLRDILRLCPDLQRLEIDGRYTPEPPLAHQPPMVLPELSSFHLRGLQNPPDIIEAIFNMIIAPRLALVNLIFDEHWRWQALNVLSPLSTKLLLQHTGFHIFISDWRIQISPIIREGVISSSSRVFINLSSSARGGGPALKVLEDVGKVAPSSATVDIVITDLRSTRLISNYLRSHVEGDDASFGHPLPQLRTFQMNVRFRANRPYEGEDVLTELAQGRQDISKIRMKIRKGSGVDDFDILQWDRASSSFVSSQ
ncbi:hypothetical protein FRC01_013430 [Tulasnella sp. 417]|nr:hypothetical protein FRC01_013430 [Tulasnella sp. 417]